MYTRVETRLIRGEREERREKREGERARKREIEHRGRGEVARAAVDHPEARCSLYPFYSRLLPSDLYDSDAPSGSASGVPFGRCECAGKAKERERERQRERRSDRRPAFLRNTVASRCEFTHCAPRKHARERCPRAIMRFRFSHLNRYV